MTNDVMNRVKHVLDLVPDLLRGVEVDIIDGEYASYVERLRFELDDFDLVRKTP